MSQQYGSKFELWQWVHGHTAGLSAALTAASVTLRGFASGITWLAPAHAGTELRDAAWTQVGLPQPTPQAAGWWPSGGPTWDGVARVTGADGRVGALFIEAKGHDREIRSSGTRAGKSSLSTIKSALDDVQNGLDVPFGTDWLGAVYQPANRLAWIWFAREHEKHHGEPVEAWLVSIYFCGGVYPWGVKPVHGPASEKQWRPIIDGLHAEMKLPEHHAVSDRVIELFLPAKGPPAPTEPAPTWQR
jgi:hypothetical protein